MTIYEEYAKIKQTVKVLQLRSKELWPQILEEIKGLSEPMRTEDGIFSVVTRTKWEFPDEVVKKTRDVMANASKEVKKIEDEARSSGNGEMISKKSVRYIGNK